MLTLKPQNLTKDTFSSALGVLLMFYAGSCYMFSFPNERDLWVNMGEACTGFVLLFIDGNVIAEKLKSFLFRKLDNK